MLEKFLEKADKVFIQVLQSIQAVLGLFLPIIRVVDEKGVPTDEYGYTITVGGVPLMWIMIFVNFIMILILR